MQRFQEAPGQFHRKRLFITIVVAILVLILTLTFYFVEEKRGIEQRTHTYADNAMQRFNRLFSPLEAAASNTLGLIGLPCEQVRNPLIEKLSSLQTVRSIALVNNDNIYCSSLFGASHMPFSTLYPELALNNQHMLLSTDQYLLKGSPILLLWTPDDSANRSGILLSINIEMMSNYLLEPTLPWVERAVFSVGGKSLEYSSPIINKALTFADEVSYKKVSQQYPFTLTLFGPSPSHLALSILPTQLPLALLLSLLMAWIVWLVTPNRMSLSWQISYGITAGEFMVYCQPLINSKTGVCNGIELLLRWHNPRQGWIPPDVFIPLAERQNLIAPLTRYVLSEVVRQLPQLPSYPTFHISINVAASHFHNHAIIDDLQRLWWPANPVPQLVIELTERDSLPEADQRVVRHLHEIGVKLAIDDFGTGHSSLSYLKTLSPDVLKIDKVFTASIGTDAINATVTDMVISLAQRLNINLVAEGVETNEQAIYLREKGVDVLQGYYYARPMPLSDFPQWFREHMPTTG